MATNPHPFRSDASKAHGLGPAGHGTHHWIYQRLTAIVIAPLAVWFWFSVITKMIGAPILVIEQWFSSPYVAVLMAAFIIAVCTHAKLGLQVVIEDYVHAKCTKIGMLIAIKLLYLGLMLMGLAAVASLHFNGAVEVADIVALSPVQIDEN